MQPQFVNIGEKTQRSAPEEEVGKVNARERCLSVFESLTRTADDGIVASGLYGGGVGTHVVEVVASYKQLIGVSGVGPKAALSILSVCTPQGIAMAVITGDEKALIAAPGIGKKIAQRIILEPEAVQETFCCFSLDILLIIFELLKTGSEHCLSP